MEVTNPAPQHKVMVKLRELHHAQDLFDDAVRSGNDQCIQEAKNRYQKKRQWFARRNIRLHNDSRGRPQIIQNLFAVMDQHQVSMETMAQRCDPRCIWALQQGDALDRNDALAVIQALNTLTGHSLTLDHFDICFCTAESSDVLASLKGPHCFKHKHQF